MLEPVHHQEGDKEYQVCNLVHFSDKLPIVFRARMKQLEEISHWLGGYFDAVAILLQIPGAADYEWVDADEDELIEFLWSANHGALFSVLVEALKHLGCEKLIDQVPGADSYTTRKMPVKLQINLAKRNRNEMLNVVTLCLDRIMVIPALSEWERDLHGELKSDRKRRVNKK